MHLDRLGDDLANLHARVQRAVRVLEDDLDAPPQLHQFAPFEPGNVDAVIADLAGGRAFEAQDAAPGCGLAAAALADQPQGLAAADAEVDAIDRPDLADPAMGDVPLGDREVHPQPFDFEEWISADR